MDIALNLMQVNVQWGHATDLNIEYYAFIGEHQFQNALK